MSRYSSTHNELFYLTIRTNYEDDNGIHRSKHLLWRAFGWEGSVDISGPWLSRRRYIKHRFSADHFPFDPYDNENIYATYFEKRKR